MAMRYAELMERLDIDLWVADPHAPWQRGNNDSTNGLLRRFQPKGAGLSSVRQERLNHIALLINTRPHQTFGWRPPAEAINAEIEAFNSRVAIEF